MMVGGACLWLSTAMAWTALAQQALMRWLNPPRILAVYLVKHEGAGMSKVRKLRVNRRLKSIVADGPTTNYLVQYRAGGRTFFWWPDDRSRTFELPDVADVRRARIYKARLSGNLLAPKDLTSEFAALAGHGADFHGKELTAEAVRNFLAVVCPETRLPVDMRMQLKIYSAGSKPLLTVVLD